MRMRILAGAVMLAAATLMVPTAATAAPAQALACTDWGASKPVKRNFGGNNYASVGYAWANGCAGATFQAALQHHRAWGWSPLANISWTGNGTKQLSKSCNPAETNAYRWRTTAWARNIGGGWTERPSAETRFVC